MHDLHKTFLSAFPKAELDRVVWVGGFSATYVTAGFVNAFVQLCSITVRQSVQNVSS